MPRNIMRAEVLSQWKISNKVRFEPITGREGPYGE
jgi:hypothetical protein